MFLLDPLVGCSLVKFSRYQCGGKVSRFQQHLTGSTIVRPFYERYFQHLTVFKVIIGLITHVIMEISPSFTFAVFAVACSLAYLWATYIVPETANISLEEIDAVFNSTAGRDDALLKQQVRNSALSALHDLFSDSLWQIEQDLGLHDLITELTGDDYRQ